MPRVIKLMDRSITTEELAQLARFTILWPQELPDGYRHIRIAELSESETESTGTGIFFLEFAKERERRISIWQSVNKMKPNLEELTPIGTIVLPDSTSVVLYEAGLNLTTAFFSHSSIDIELLARGMSVDEIAVIASSLNARQPAYPISNGA